LPRSRTAGLPTSATAARKGPCIDLNLQRCRSCTRSERAIIGSITPVGKRAKLIEAIRNNPKDVGFEDACKVAQWLGFTGKGRSGSHNAYSRTGEPVGLNFQNRNGKIPLYQAKQLIAMIDKYEDEL